ncbi:MAG: sugar nucleotide-binding protein [Minisyncoccia bacterium]
MKCFITGPRGLLGSTLLRVLTEAGHEAIPYEGDIRDAGAVASAVAAANPAWVVHTAAIASVADCEKNPAEAHAVNGVGTKNVTNAARAVGARCIYISTVSVFSGHEGNYKESDAPEPINVYNTTKREGEIAALAYEKSMVLRLNLVGVHPNGSRGKSFLEWLIDSIRADKDLTLFDDQFMNPLSNWTVAALIKSIIEKDISEKIVHIGTSDALSKAAVGKLVLARFPEYRGTITEKSVDSIADGIVRPKQMWLNTDRAVALLGAMPTIVQELDTVFRRPPFEGQ